MKFQHVKCGGEVELKTRRCLKCGKRWNPVSFLLTTGEIRPAPEAPRPARKPATYAGWADRVPGAGAVASRLPNWPRWARILVALAIVTGLVIVSYWVVGLL